MTEGTGKKPPHARPSISKLIERRKVLFGGGAAAGAAAALPTPAISQGIRELKMVTSWPKGLPGLSASADRICQSITAASGRKLQVKLFNAGELVKAFEAFDAVSNGVADMYHSAEYYWERQSPAFSFFAAVPFGFTADEFSAWIHFGGGQALWDELSAGFNIKPLLMTSTGAQMGGWFTKQVQGPESFAGLRYRMPGLGGEVLRRLGAVVVSLPGSEIVPALKSGAIDACEWVGPWNDIALGLHKVSKYYYYPGFHEPGTGVAVGINKGTWDGLAPEERSIIQTVANAEFTYSLAEFNANNANGLQELSKEQGLELRRFDDSLLRALLKASEEVLADVGNKNALCKRIYQSFIEFRSRAASWAEVAERSFLNSRTLNTVKR